MNSSSDHFIVCGLGRLGCYCVHDLKRYETDELQVEITAIERQPMSPRQQKELRSFLHGAILTADCTGEGALDDAGIQTARAILLVTNDESANVQAAIAARRLNPNVRLVVRCTKPNLTDLLAKQLGNFVALNPTDLPAQAFALAAWQRSVHGIVEFEDCEIRISTQTVREHTHSRVCELEPFPRDGLRIIGWQSPQRIGSDDATKAHRSFFQWESDRRAGVGDSVTTVEVIEKSTLVRRVSKPRDARTWPSSAKSIFQTMCTSHRQFRPLMLWVNAKRSRLFVAIGMLLAILLWLIAVLMFKSQIAGITWAHSMTSAVLLLIGGYGDLFGGFDRSVLVPIWVHLVALTITAVSFLYVLSALGVLAENLLNARFSMLRRPKLPTDDHVILIGMKRLGKRVAFLLKTYGQEVVAVVDEDHQSDDQLGIPVLNGNPVDLLSRLHLHTARSLVVLTDDELVNMEIALAAKSHAAERGNLLGLVVRAYDDSFGRNLLDLLPQAKILVAHELSAAAFAAAAFGENVLGVFRLRENTIVVAEYQVATGDHLEGRMLAEIAYGYGTVPIVLTRAEGAGAKRQYLPPDDVQLRAGDTLVLLASTNGLRRIERGMIERQSRYKITVQQPLIADILFSAGSDIARVSGCSLESARTLMENLPGVIELPLYHQQLRRLQSVLSWQLPIAIEDVTPKSVTLSYQSEEADQTIS